MMKIILARLREDQKSSGLRRLNLMPTIAPLQLMLQIEQPQQKKPMKNLSSTENSTNSMVSFTKTMALPGTRATVCKSEVSTTIWKPFTKGTKTIAKFRAVTLKTSKSKKLERMSWPISRQQRKRLLPKLYGTKGTTNSMGSFTKMTVKLMNRMVKKWKVSISLSRRNTGTMDMQNITTANLTWVRPEVLKKGTLLKAWIENLRFAVCQADWGKVII